MEKKKATYNSLKEVPASAWKELSDKKIYFGHQSVGYNIIDGLNDLMAEHPDIKINVVENKEDIDFQKGAFVHSKVGANNDPKSKLEDFNDILNSGVGQHADMAALKYCYVDINRNTDVQQMFNDYRNTVTSLKKKYPDLNILHFTSPLTQQRTTWKTWLKKLLGKKDLWEYKDNIKRNEYNELLRHEFNGKDPILDIALIESTKPDGTRQSFDFQGKSYFSMVPEYTSDGGHLNETGRRKVAENLVLIILGM